MIVPPARVPDLALNLAMALVDASSTPLLLLDGTLSVIAASKSFCATFGIEPEDAVRRPIFDLGAGDWDMPRLRAVLAAAVSGDPDSTTCEMDLRDGRRNARHLVLNIRRLDYGSLDQVRLMVAIADVTDARAAEKLKDDLVLEKGVLLQEIQHRVANSLQIIASVLMQSARQVSSEETRGHLRDAHSRVMSIASVQHQLAQSGAEEVEIRPYLVQLCQSLGVSMIRDHEQLSIAVAIDEAMVRAEVSVSIGLVVTELVINALKHAFPDRRKGRILVTYRVEASGWSLSVADDGVGIPMPAKVPRSGLGTGIIIALAAQLRADLSVADNAPGTRISLVHDEASVED